MTAPAGAARAGVVRVSGTVLRTLTRCERRLHLEHHASGCAAAASDHDRMLRDRAYEHQRRVRESFVGAIGPIRARERGDEAAAEETLRLLRETRAPLHQPVFLSPAGDAIGNPDFVYWEGDGLVVHDVRLATRLEGHDEIALQLTHFGALVEEAAGVRPVRLEVTTGRHEVLPVAPLPTERYRALRARARALLDGGPEPDLLRAHSECESCPFYRHCWDQAERDRRPEVVRGVRRSALPRLRELGVRTLDDLAALEPARLKGVRGIGAHGDRWVLAARAVRDRAPVWVQRPALPAGRPRVWLDLEGDSHMELGEPFVYLWGLAVDQADGLAAEALWGDVGPGGDVAGWRRFLARAGVVLAVHPEAVWVHYAGYERSALRTYAARHGDPDGVAARVLERSYDLLSGLEHCVHLPLRSLSIKHVAAWTGFAWSDPESGATWSLVQYRRACATTDEAERGLLLERIARYNADDLAALRAVWEWLERSAPQA